MKCLTTMNAVKYIAFVLLLANNASADYLECYVCENCEENEGHFEYCPPLEDIQTITQLMPDTPQVTETSTTLPTVEAALGATSQEYYSPDLVTAFTYFVTEESGAALIPLQTTKPEAPTRPFSENTTQTINSATDSFLTALANLTSTLTGNGSMEESPTGATVSQNILDPNGDVTFDHSSTETLIIVPSYSNNTELTTAEVVNFTEAIVNATENPAISGINAVNMTANATMTNLTDSLPATSGVTKETTFEIETTMNEMWTTYAGIGAETTTGANITSIVDGNTTKEINQTIAAESQNTTVPMEAPESIEWSLKNSTISMEMALEITTEASGGNRTESITLSTVSVSAGDKNSAWGNLITEEPKDLNTTLEMGTTAISEETTMSSMAIFNSTTAQIAEANVTDSLGLVGSSNELLLNLTAATRPGNAVEVQTVFGNFGNLTATNVSNGTNFVFEPTVAEVNGATNNTTNSSSSNNTSQAAGYGSFVNVTTTEAINETDSVSTNPVASGDSYNILQATGLGISVNSTTTLGANETLVPATTRESNTNTLAETILTNSVDFATQEFEPTKATNFSLDNTTAYEGSNNAYHKKEIASQIEPTNEVIVSAFNYTNWEDFAANTTVAMELASATNESLSNVSSAAKPQDTFHTVLANGNKTSEEQPGSKETANSTGAFNSTKLEVVHFNSSNELELIATASVGLSNLTFTYDAYGITQALNTSGSLESATLTKMEPTSESMIDSLQAASSEISAINKLNATNVSDFPQQTGFTKENTTSVKESYDFMGFSKESSEFNASSEIDVVGLAETADLNSAKTIIFDKNTPPTSTIRTETNLDKEKPNAKKSIFGQELTERLFQPKEPQRRRSVNILQQKYSKKENFAATKMGNITYKCYSVRVRGKNKVQINKGCVAVRPAQNACALLADKYGAEALEGCQLCLEGKCNRSHGNELRYSAKVGTLIMSIGWLIGALMS